MGKYCQNLSYVDFKKEWIRFYEIQTGKPCDVMRESLKNTIECAPMRTWWLSFIDPDKPEGTRFIGVVIIDGCDFPDADCRSHYLGINPGGEISAIDITEISNEIDYCDKNRLLSKNEALKY